MGRKGKPFSGFASPRLQWNSNGAVVSLLSLTPDTKMEVEKEPHDSFKWIHLSTVASSHPAGFCVVKRWFSHHVQLQLLQGKSSSEEFPSEKRCKKGLSRVGANTGSAAPAGIWASWGYKHQRRSRGYSLHPLPWEEPCSSVEMPLVSTRSCGLAGAGELGSRW